MNYDLIPIHGWLTAEKQQVSENKTKVIGSFKPIKTPIARSMLKDFSFYSNRVGAYYIGKNAPLGFSQISTLPAGINFEYNRQANQLKFLIGSSLQQIIQL